jgi:mannose-1-phosphate guanylyltransferase
MEHSDRCAVVPAGFAWSDVGSWDVVAELFGAALDAREAEKRIAVDSEANFVFSDLPVALVGVRDLIVVVKNGIVMVCPKGRSQQVKDVVQRLNREGRADLL